MDEDTDDEGFAGVLFDGAEALVSLLATLAALRSAPFFELVEAVLVAGLGEAGDRVVDAAGVVAGTRASRS